MIRISGLQVESRRTKTISYDLSNCIFFSCSKNFILTRYRYNKRFYIPGSKRNMPYIRGSTKTTLSNGQKYVKFRFLNICSIPPPAPFLFLLLEIHPFPPCNGALIWFKPTQCIVFTRYRSFCQKLTNLHLAPTTKSCELYFGQLLSNAL